VDSAPPRRGLGQGLALLLGEQQGRLHGALREIPTDQITPNPRQPRARIDEERFAELVESVRQDGIVQPVLVRGVGTGWELIAGERRWRAAQAAGMTTVPALVREADDRTSLALALVENIVRADLDPIEQARGYARLEDEFGLTHAEVATAVGRSRTAIVNATRLLGLPDEVLALIERGELTEGHGRALLRIVGQDERREAAQAVVAGKLSVRPTEALARTRGRTAPRRRAAGAPDWYDAELANDAVDAVYRLLGVAARVTPDRSGCRVELRLRSRDELAALAARLAALEGGAPGRD
jgi:ParB family chromosome partitioning protein